MKYPDLENFLVRAVETYQYNLEHYPEENPTMLGALDEEFNESWTLKFEDDTAKRKEAEKTVFAVELAEVKSGWKKKLQELIGIDLRKLQIMELKP